MQDAGILRVPPEELPVIRRDVVLVGNLRITRTDGELHIPVAGDGKTVAIGETYAEDIGALIHSDGAEYLDICLAPESI
jgi:hypothetical protein